MPAPVQNLRKSQRRLGRRGPVVRRAAVRLAPLLLLAFLLSCSLRAVKLGAVLPLTGPYAAYGASIREGVLLAQERVNLDGGIQGRTLDVLFRDSRSQPQVAQEEFLRLVKDDRVPAVVGGATSAEALAMAPVAERFQRLLFSPSASSPRLSASGDWVFRNWPSDEIEGQTLADFAAYSLHATRVLMVVERDAYAASIGDVFADRFASGDRSVARVDFASGDAVDGAFVQRVKEAARGAQVLFLAGYAEAVLPLAGKLKAAGIDLPVLASSALAGTALLKERAADAEGMIFARPTFDPASNDPAVQTFLADFRKRFGHDPDTYAAHAYDAVKILAGAMASEGTAAADIRRGLMALRNYEGVAGTTSFDAHGAPIQSFQICTARNGQAVPLKDVLDDVLLPLQKRVEEIRFGR